MMDRLLPPPAPGVCSGATFHTWERLRRLWQNPTLCLTKLRRGTRSQDRLPGRLLRSPQVHRAAATFLPSEVEGAGEPLRAGVRGANSKEATNCRGLLSTGRDHREKGAPGSHGEPGKIERGFQRMGVPATAWAWSWRPGCKGFEGFFFLRFRVSLRICKSLKSSLGREGSDFPSNERKPEGPAKIWGR